MSTPEGTGVSRPLRTSGLVLLTLAAAAALIGLAIVATGEERTSANQRPAVTSTSQPASTEPTSSSVPPTPSLTPIPFPPPEPTTIPVPPPVPAPGSSVPGPVVSEPVAPEPGGKVIGGTPDLRGETRVYNNSTIRGLAARAADDLNAAGWTVIEVANYSGGRIPTSTVYYREGTDERATAEAIGAEFGLRVEPRFDGIADARPGVIVIVTNDYGT
ncbi:MAG: LytR C-terminal domain-containing protein [Pseudonocardiaceae bacterium]